MAILRSHHLHSPSFGCSAPFACRGRSGLGAVRNTTASRPTSWDQFTKRLRTPKQACFSAAIPSEEQSLLVGVLTCVWQPKGDEKQLSQTHGLQWWTHSPGPLMQTILVHRKLSWRNCFSSHFLSWLPEVLTVSYLLSYPICFLPKHSPLVNIW